MDGSKPNDSEPSAVRTSSAAGAELGPQDNLDIDMLPAQHDRSEGLDAIVRAIACAPARRPQVGPVPGMFWGSGDRYLIERRLGEGGMGTVYAARDTLLGRPVALKVLHDRSTIEESTSGERILREARLAAEVPHERIARIYDVSEHKGSPFLAMEFLGGVTLRRQMGHDEITERDVFVIAVEIAEGLAELHARGLVHGDLKPENVILCDPGGAKLVDFGLARHSGNESNATAGGGPFAPGLRDSGDSFAPSGTPGYVAPERFDGRPLDPRADVFALGVILHELVRGIRPFRGDRPSPMHWPPAFSEREWARFPLSLRNVVARMLALDPEERLSDGAQVLHALREVVTLSERARPAERRAAPSLAFRSLLARTPQCEELRAQLLADPSPLCKAIGIDVRSVVSLARLGSARVDLLAWRADHTLNELNLHLLQLESPSDPLIATSPPGAACMLVVGGPQTGKEVELSAAPFEIGRSPWADMRAHERGISRHHACIAFDGTDHWIRDLQSTNGTFVNGSRVREHRLRDGDNVRVGARVLKFIRGPLVSRAIRTRVVELLDAWVWVQNHVEETRALVQPPLRHLPERLECRGIVLAGRRAGLRVQEAGCLDRYTATLRGVVQVRTYDWIAEASDEV